MQGILAHVGAGEIPAGAVGVELEAQHVDLHVSMAVHPAVACGRRQGEIVGVGRGDGVDGSAALVDLVDLVGTVVGLGQPRTVIGDGQRHRVTGLAVVGLVGGLQLHHRGFHAGQAVVQGQVHIQVEVRVGQRFDGVQITVQVAVQLQFQAVGLRGRFSGNFRVDDDLGDRLGHRRAQHRQTQQRRQQRAQQFAGVHVHASFG